MVRKITPEIVRILLILLFAYAAISKLIAYPKFIIQLGLSPLLPSYITSIAWSIPLIELALVVVLISQVYFRFALIASAGLLFVFTLYIIGILTIADHIPCSCGGVLDSLSWTGHLLFNIGFLTLTLIAIVTSKTSPYESV